ncbi:TPA: haloacid dehalogenase type II [Photobacterium damselae]|uniref:haloacid dehalogenase type II n=1 Tax=Photobacterium damselae TaxID=38293 RepID=UPI001EDE4F95|nr:haloacid dehalogenase type II [Photobacterium damselae]MCG3826009.1 haloacid dehalogenase type II [Photobacterium damselae]
MNKDIIIFDINETILNLESLHKIFVDIFDNNLMLSQWFSKLLHTSAVCAITKVETNFFTLASITLDNMFDDNQLELSKFDKKEFLNEFTRLQPYSDVIPALKYLKENGFKLIALSNSSSKLINEQLNNSGVISFFDEIISAEEVTTFKPDPQVYKYAAKRLGVSLNRLRLVATHDWDTHGALSVGMKAAYLSRNDKKYTSVFKKVDIKGSDMMEIAYKIVQS